MSGCWSAVVGFPRFTPIQVPWFAVQGSRSINDLNPYANYSLRTGFYDLIFFNRYISKNFFSFSVFPQRTNPKTPQTQTQASHTFHDSRITNILSSSLKHHPFFPAVGITITCHQWPESSHHHRSNSKFDSLDYARTEIEEQYNHISDEGKPLFDESWIRRKQSLTWSSINNLELSTAAAPPILHYQHGKHQLAHCKRKKSWEHLLIDASWTAKLQK